MSPGGEVAIVVNGEQRAVAAGTALLALIESLGLTARSVLVEHNGTALLRAEWPAVRLAEGDRLEILRIVAGG